MSQVLLSKDILEKIFDYLEPFELIQCSNVSHTWNRYASTPNPWRRWYENATQCRMINICIDWKKQVLNLLSRLRNQRFEDLYPLKCFRFFVTYQWYLFFLLICFGLFMNLKLDGFRLLDYSTNFKLSTGVVRNSTLRHWVEETEDRYGWIMHYNRYHVLVTFEILHQHIQEDIAYYPSNKKSAAAKLNEFQIGQQHLVYVSKTTPFRMSLTRDYYIEWYHLLFVTCFMTIPISILPLSQIIYLSSFRQTISQPLFAFPIKNIETRQTIPMVRLVTRKAMESDKILLLYTISILFLELFGVIPLCSLIFFENDPNLVSNPWFSNALFILENLFVILLANVWYDEFLKLKPKSNYTITLWKEGRNLKIDREQNIPLYIRIERNEHFLSPIQIQHVQVKIYFNKWINDTWHEIKKDYTQALEPPFTVQPHPVDLYNFNSDQVKWIKFPDFGNLVSSYSSNNSTRCRAQIIINKSLEELVEIPLP